MIYLYAITEASAALPDGEGFDELPLQLAKSGNVAALFSAHEFLDTRPQTDVLLRHEQVVEAAMRQGPTLPARFGTTFASDQALHAAVQRDGDRLWHQLQQVRGCVELAVRVGLPPRPNPAAQDGRGYLQSKLAERRELERITTAVLSPLGELAVRTRVAESRSAADVLRASYLVRDELIESFADEARLLADRHPDLSLSCTGPWPPYSFVELEEAA